MNIWNYLKQNWDISITKKIKIFIFEFIMNPKVVKNCLYPIKISLFIYLWLCIITLIVVIVLDSSELKGQLFQQILIGIFSSFFVMIGVSSLTYFVEKRKYLLDLKTRLFSIFIKLQMFLKDINESLYIKHALSKINDLLIEEDEDIEFKKLSFEFLIQKGCLYNFDKKIKEMSLNPIRDISTYLIEIQNDNIKKAKKLLIENPNNPQLNYYLNRPFNEEELKLLNVKFNEVIQVYADKLSHMLQCIDKKEFENCKPCPFISVCFNNVNVNKEPITEDELNSRKAGQEDLAEGETLSL